jgi:hypothetical protein
MFCTLCETPVKARAFGYCSKHYQRWRAHGDASAPPARGRIYALDQSYFDQVNTPDRAYWLGFLAADGYVHKKNGSLTVELAEKDREHVRLLAETLGSGRPLQENRGCVALCVNSKHMVASLESIGIMQRKSGIVEPWDGPPALMPYYWRGLWDGDGHISRIRNYWNIGICGSLACVQGFADWSREICGATGKPFPGKASPDCWKWDVAGKRMPQALARVLKLEGSDFGLRRKQVLLEELSSTYFRQTRAGGRRLARPLTA